VKRKSVLNHQRRELEKQNAKRSSVLFQVPRDKWPETGRVDSMIEAWLSSRFLVQVFDEGGGIFRVSVNRTSMDQFGKWEENLTWDELMSVKRQIGRGESYAVEVLPEDSQIVNVANMRHFWILPDPVCGWKQRYA
jgi:hypothetical protein